MGGGAPLAFLNKKSWHTGGLRQQEEVWKREQEYAKEQKKLQELKKQIEDERKREELQEVAAAGGHVQKTERLDWMYAGSIGSKQMADERTEAAMNQPAKLDASEEAQQSRCEKASVLPSFYAEDVPMAALEQWQRLNNDPLFAIKRQEAAARAKIKSNPVKMMEIQKEIKTLRGKKEKKEKKDRKGGKEKKERRERGDAERESERSGHHGKRRRSRSGSPGRGREQDPAPRRDDASVQRPRGAYGLDSAHVPEHARRANGSTGESTRERLQEAARRKEEEERSAAERRRLEKHRVGRLTEDEKEQRRREMMSQASEHEAGRHTAVQNYTRQEEEEERDRARHADHSSFSSKINKDVLARRAPVLGSQTGSAGARTTAREGARRGTASGDEAFANQSVRGGGDGGSSGCMGPHCSHARKLGRMDGVQGSLNRTTMALG
eukprot:CAMPEP_0177609484 /NCGR_PEP_ID=MMETSP0419_2-20121207/19119_1 /TAXON_ID=582737 /ORGANISM="Tetraselmis sp., Strain GSL018" /LENGTH=437 /DNA_ID=CAMNT_0019104423 /DNA_START=97 /DNA_END=1412 /DNA_ORIENTATION=+